MLESLFNKVVSQVFFQFKFSKILRSPILKKIWERLLLSASENTSIACIRETDVRRQTMQPGNKCFALQIYKPHEVNLIHLLSNSFLYSRNKLSRKYPALAY